MILNYGDYNTLMHFGKKGMKWGRRKNKEPSNTKKTKKSKINVKKVAIGSAIAIGVIGVSALVAYNNKSKIIETGKKLVDIYGNRPIKDIPVVHYMPGTPMQNTSLQNKEWELSIRMHDFVNRQMIEPEKWIDYFQSIDTSNDYWK